MQVNKTVVSLDDGHIVARNMYRKEINKLRKIVHQVGFVYKIIQGCRSTKQLFLLMMGTQSPETCREKK